MAKRTRVDLSISGTHCASCEVLLERRLKKIPGVTNAKVNYATGKAYIETERPVSKTALAQAVNKDGYALRAEQAESGQPLKARDYAQIGGLFLFFVALYMIAKQFSLLPSVGVSEGMSLGVVFVIGLIAATSTCLAVTGGLLLALAAKYSEANPNLSAIKRFKPTLYFNAGRIIGYALFGAALGAIGSLFTFSPTASGILTVVAALIMILLGLQMLRVFPLLNRISIRMPKRLAHAVFDKTTGAYKPWAPFVLGAGTFFVPCGFTQALQFYVLAHGSAVQGGVTMLVFALGTLPVLVAIGAASSFTRGALHRHFVRTAAVLVVLLGILSLPAGISLLSLGSGSGAGIVTGSEPTNIVLENGVQVARMTVDGLSYSPHTFVVTQGVPVRWEIDGKLAEGCGQVITAPSIGATKSLSRTGLTVIEFTPTKTGTIPFSCTMGMTTPGSQFTVVPAGSAPAVACDNSVADCL